MSTDEEKAIKIIKLAFNFALRQKLNTLTSKGRPITPRAIGQWRRSRCNNDVAKILHKAFKDAEEITSTTNNEIVFSVVCRLLESIPRIGRPKKRIGLIASAMQSSIKKLPGRPPTTSMEKEKGWARYVLGVKCRLLADAYHIRDYAQLYERLTNEPDFEKEISDARAIEEAQRRLSTKQGIVFDPTCLPAIKTRYARTKRIYSMEIPPPKSGG